METDNPAQRLHDLLVAMRAHTSEGSARSVWSLILGTKGDAELIARLGAVMALPQAVMQALDEQNPGDGKHHSHWIAPIASFLSRMNLDASWSEVRKNVSHQVVSFAFIGARLLSNHGRARSLSVEERDSLREELSGLQASVEKSDLPPDLKRYLLAQIRRMVAALQEYAISGTTELLEVIEATLGHIGCREEYRNNQSPVFRQVLDGLAGIANSVTIATGAPALVYTAAALLSS